LANEQVLFAILSDLISDPVLERMSKGEAKEENQKQETP